MNASLFFATVVLIVIEAVVMRKYELASVLFVSSAVIALFLCEAICRAIKGRQK